MRAGKSRASILSHCGHVSIAVESLQQEETAATLTLGAHLAQDGRCCHFRVWAPSARRVRLRLLPNASGHEATEIEMSRDEAGYFFADANASVGDRYFYIFDGNKRSPYLETDPPNPMSAYGRTKLEGETRVRAAGCRHLILRTAWVYGRGGNFVRAILRQAEKGASLRVVNDQIGAPTWARDIARVTSDPGGR